MRGHPLGVHDHHQRHLSGGALARTLGYRAVTALRSDSQSIHILMPATDNPRWAEKNRDFSLIITHYQYAEDYLELPEEPYALHI